MYNNMNCNALVLCPYFLCICVQCEPRFRDDCTILKNAIHTEETVSEIVPFLFSPLVFLRSL